MFISNSYSPKNLASILGLLVLFLSLSLCSLHASPTGWEFGEPEGTPLGSVIGTNPKMKWSSNLGDSTTSGTGGLLLRNKNGENIISHCKLEAAKQGEHTWLVVSITRWRFSKPASRRVGIGFASSVGANHRVLAEIILDGSSERGLRVLGNAVPKNEGASGTKSTQLRESEGGSPLMLALEYVPERNAYNLYYLNDKGVLESLGSGTTSAARSPKYVFINLKNELDGTASEFMEIGAIAVSYRK